MEKKTSIFEQPYGMQQNNLKNNKSTKNAPARSLFYRNPDEKHLVFFTWPKIITCHRTCISIYWEYSTSVVNNDMVILISSAVEMVETAISFNVFYELI